MVYQWAPGKLPHSPDQKYINPKEVTEEPLGGTAVQLFISTSCMFYKPQRICIMVYEWAFG